MWSPVEKGETLLKARPASVRPALDDEGNECLEETSAAPELKIVESDPQQEQQQQQQQ